jgi:imidazoleglycerol-phosphate dehydratase
MGNDRMDPRASFEERSTSETTVTVRLNLDGTGTYDNASGIGFLDHMLDLLARHSGFDLEVKCEGDLHVDDHHTVEDIGISLGRAFSSAVGDKAFIARYGHAYVPMDESLARAVVDLSGRFAFLMHADFERPQVGDLSSEMVGHFWSSFAEHAACNLHIELLYGTNTHHQVEAIFKSVARALRVAVSRDTSHGRVASTKGTL